MAIQIYTPYGEYMKDDNDLPLQFDNEQQAKDFLGAIGWDEAFIDNCEYEDVSNGTKPTR